MASYDDTATVSGSVVSIENGADDVPTKSLVVTISPPTLSGVSSVTETQSDGDEYEHEYTASLGRTIYGGTADIVNGEGQELVKKITVSSFTGTWGAVTNGYAYYISVADTTHSTSVVNPIMMQANQLFTYGSVGRNSAPTWQYGGNDGGTTVHTFILPSEYDTLTKANNFLSSLQTPLEVTLTLATPTDFTFDGQEIPTRLGYNEFWSEQGDTELTYYKSGYGFTSVTVNKNGVSQTAKLHKVIYGGKADVVKGTCEPKNLFDSADASHTFTSASNTQYNMGTISLKGGVTYTFSAKQEDDLTSNTRNTLVIYDNGTYEYEYGTGTNYHNQSGVHSMQYTPNADTTVSLIIWVHTPSNDVTYSEFQVEKGSLASDYVPHFEPFTFPPISMGTDEGENTLFANEGDSAITYRKAVD